MAFTVRGYYTANGGTVAGTSAGTIPVTGWTTANPQAGDLLVIGLLGAATTPPAAFSQSGGNTTFTVPGSAADTSTALATWAAYHVLGASDTLPAVNFSSAYWAYIIMALTPSGGSQAFDAGSVALAGATTSATWTPPALSAATADEVSVILNLSRMPGTGVNTITQTPPSGWAAVGGAGYGGATTRPGTFAGAAIKTVTAAGTSQATPGSETVAAGAAVTTTNTYQLLFSESGGAPAGPPVQVCAPRVPVSALASPGAPAVFA